MHKYLALAVACALLAGTSSAAQERPMEKAAFTSAAQAQLSPDLKPLAFLEGTWDVEQRFMMPGAPGMEGAQNGLAQQGKAVREEHARDHRAKPDQQIATPKGLNAPQSGSGMLMRGTFRVKRDLAGRALIGKFEADGLQGEGFFGHMILTAERRNGEKGDPLFTAYWADSKGITSFSKDVEWDHDTLSIESADSQSSLPGECSIFISLIASMPGMYGFQSAVAIP